MINKEKLVDSMGRPLTQSLFLEIGYSDYAVYTLKEYDYPYKGKHYPSLKKLYLKEEDPTEYVFAEKHLLGWQHWKRLCENKVIAKHIEEWREEMELKIRSQAVRDMMNLCASENGNFSAAKFLADKGWEKRTAGRPSKQEKERHLRMEEKIVSEFEADIVRLSDVRK
ncbi:hypothetical protein D3C85_167140 [compost metagenome]